MTTFVLIDEQTFPTDTAEEIAAARAALRKADLDSAAVWAGDPEGDSQRNGQILWADLDKPIPGAPEADCALARSLRVPCPDLVRAALAVVREISQQGPGVLARPTRYEDPG